METKSAGKPVSSPKGSTTSSPTKEKGPPGEKAGEEKKMMMEDGDYNKDEKTVEEKEEIVPDEQGATGGWGGWLSTTLSSAKEKSTEMFQYLKQDLSEFGETVQEAGRDLKDKLKLEDTAKTAVNTVGEKMNTILEQVSSIFGVAPEDDEDTTMIVTKDGPLVLSRIQARIHSIAMNEEIFLKDPDVLELYEIWLANFDLEEKQDEMADLLSNNPHLQLHYSQLVPDKVSHLVFWHRFYFQVHLIATEEETMAYQEALESKKTAKRAGEPGRDSESPTDSQNGTDIVNISEEDQRRLLAEYEEEIKKLDISGGSSSGNHSRRSSDNQMSSSSSSSFAFVTHDPVTDDVKVE